MVGPCRRPAASNDRGTLAVPQVSSADSTASLQPFVPRPRVCAASRAVSAASDGRRSRRPTLRIATLDDGAAIEALMKASAAVLFAALLRRAADGERRPLRRRGRPAAARRRHVLRPRERRRDRRLRRLEQARPHPHRQRRPRRRRPPARPGDRAGARAGDVRPRRLDAPRPRTADPRGVRGRRAPRGFHRAGADGDPARRAALPRLRLRADGRPRGDDAGRRRDRLRLDEKGDRAGPTDDGTQLEEER